MLLYSPPEAAIVHCGDEICDALQLKYFVLTHVSFVKISAFGCFGELVCSRLIIQIPSAMGDRELSTTVS